MDQAQAGDGFHDRNARYSYLVACAVARMIAADPAVLRAGWDHLERFTKRDPHQADGYRLWTGLLAAGPDAVVARLTERSLRGDYARQTAPSFGPLQARLRTSLLRQARQPLPAVVQTP